MSQVNIRQKIKVYIYTSKCRKIDLRHGLKTFLLNFATFKPFTYQFSRRLADVEISTNFDVWRRW